jgi:hypothetical protein
MNILMISCQKATELIDKRQALGLSLPERFRLHFHTAMCDACQLYESQSRVVDRLLGKELRKDADSGSVSDDQLSRLTDRILPPKK